MRLGNAGNHSVLDRVRAQLNWQHLLRVDGLALSTGLPGERVADALHALGASGLVGYDVAEQGYFHRVLPFDLSGIEDAHPRLAAARELLEHAAVHLDDGAVFAATVDSDGGAHRVRAVDAEIRCTCPWFARHGAERGPCKHVLAARSAWEARA
jgi:hypothetical protein